MKTFQVLAFVMLMSSLGYAQKVDRPLYVNPKGGINISGLSEELKGLKQGSAQIGYSAGIDFRIGDGVVFFQPGAFFYEYNAEYRITEPVLAQSGTVSYNTDILVQSIKVPTQLGIRVFTTKLLAVRANLGPAFNFAVNIEEDPLFPLNPDHFKTVSVGGVVGAGVDLTVFTIDLNYEFGLSDYVEFKNPNVQTSSSNQYVLTLSLGVRL